MKRDEIIRLTLGHELIAPDVLPFEIGNALSAMLKRRRITPEELIEIWDATQKIPVDLRSIDIRKALEIASQFRDSEKNKSTIVVFSKLNDRLCTL